LIDEVVLTSNQDGFRATSERALNEGILAGISSGTAYTLPGSDELAALDKPHGHDAFLIETGRLKELILEWLPHRRSAEAATAHTT